MGRAWRTPRPQPDPSSSALRRLRRLRGDLHRGNGVVMRTLLVLAGLGQIALSLGSLAIPRALGWIEDTAKLRPLTRQVFWTYATYIWATNVCFGLISSVAPDLLLDRSSLARLVCGFIATYWGARVIVQFVLF